jgi:hypothetical protein
MLKRIGMTLSICIYKKIYICIVVAQDFQVSDSGSWEPLVLELPWNPPLKNLWIRAWITVENRSLLITGIISPVGVLVSFMKDTTTFCLVIVMANFDDTLSITKL